MLSLWCSFWRGDPSEGVNVEFPREETLKRRLPAILGRVRVELEMSLPLNIDDLIHQRKVESARIEYKKDWNPEKVLHSVCAFANDIDNWGGGYIIRKELDLAEGRNTGIGKIVRAMRENGSPDPQFYNPETRSFMTVILPIHEAFKADEPPIEAGTTAKTSMKSGVGTVNGTVNDTVNDLQLPFSLADRIVEAIKANNRITYDALAAATGASRRTISREIKILSQQGVLRRIGSDKTGHWEVIR